MIETKYYDPDPSDNFPNDKTTVCQHDSLRFLFYKTKKVSIHQGCQYRFVYMDNLVILYTYREKGLSEPDFQHWLRCHYLTAQSYKILSCLSRSPIHFKGSYYLVNLYRIVD